MELLGSVGVYLCINMDRLELHEQHRMSTSLVWQRNLSQNIECNSSFQNAAERRNCLSASMQLCKPFSLSLPPIQFYKHELPFIEYDRHLLGKGGCSLAHIPNMSRFIQHSFVFSEAFVQSVGKTDGYPIGRVSPPQETNHIYANIIWKDEWNRGLGA